MVRGFVPSGVRLPVEDADQYVSSLGTAPQPGLLFTTGDKPSHQQGDILKDGREIIIIEALKPMVYFCETS